MGENIRGLLKGLTKAVHVESSSPLPSQFTDEESGVQKENMHYLAAGHKHQEEHPGAQILVVILLGHRR